MAATIGTARDGATRRPHITRCRLVPLTAVLLCALAGCSATDEDSSRNPYAEDFEIAIENSQSEFVTEVLSDYTITPAEYAEAQNRVISCMSSMGVEAEYIVDEFGNPGLNTLATREASAARSECTNKWMGQIDGLYLAIKTNPDNIDRNTLVANCLVRRGIVPEGFTGEDYREVMAPWTFSGEGLPPPKDLGNGEYYVELPTSLPSVTFPGGTAGDAPEVLECEDNPLRQP